MIYSDLNPLAFKLQDSSSGKWEDVIAEEGENKSRFVSSRAPGKIPRNLTLNDRLL